MGTTATKRRHRSWPEALKREIVAASFAPGSSVSMVALHYDVNANQVFSWRKLYRDDPPTPAVSSVPQMIPVMVQHVKHTPQRLRVDAAAEADTIFAGNINLDRLRDRRRL